MNVSAFWHEFLFVRDWPVVAVFYCCYSLVQYFGLIKKTDDFSNGKTIADKRYFTLFVALFINCLRWFDCCRFLSVHIIHSLRKQFQYWKYLIYTMYHQCYVMFSKSRYFSKRHPTRDMDVFYTSLIWFFLLIPYFHFTHKSEALRIYSHLYMYFLWYLSNGSVKRQKLPFLFKLLLNQLKNIL